eukprot:13535770-Alexandrium_andersonii.AAC.1
MGCAVGGEQKTLRVAVSNRRHCLGGGLLLQAARADPCTGGLRGEGVSLTQVSASLTRSVRR